MFEPGLRFEIPLIFWYGGYSVLIGGQDDLVLANSTAWEIGVMNGFPLSIFAKHFHKQIKTKVITNAHSIGI